MPYRRDQNIFQLTERLHRSNEKDTRRYAIWLALGASVFLADIAANAYWKATTGHTMVECYVLHPTGCDAPSMKIHGE